MNISKCTECKKTIVGNEIRKINGVPYCAKHYGQMVSFDMVFDNNPRTIYNDNGYEIYPGTTIAKVYTYDSRGGITNHFFVNVEDLEKVLEKKWRFNKKDGRFVTGRYRKDGKGWELGRYILDIQDDKTKVDFIDANPRHAYRSNLREATFCQDMQNFKIKSNNTSGYTGVYRVPGHKDMWACKIQANHKQVYLGSFDNLDQAGYCRNIAERILFGDFRYREDDEWKEKRFNTIPVAVRSRIKEGVIKKIEIINLVSA